MICTKKCVFLLFYSLLFGFGDFLRYCFLCLLYALPPMLKLDMLCWSFIFLKLMSLLQTIQHISVFLRFLFHFSSKQTPPHSKKWRQLLSKKTKTFLHFAKKKRKKPPTNYAPPKKTPNQTSPHGRPQSGRLRSMVSATERLDIVEIF